MIMSCTSVESESAKSTVIKNADSEEITFIIDLSVNADSNEDLNLFAKEITENVINNEDFCLEYGYFVSEDGSFVTLMKNILIANLLLCMLKILCQALILKDFSIYFRSTNLS